VWDLSQRATAKALVAAVLVFLCSLAVSCSGETAGEGRATTGQPEDREGSTLLTSPGDEPETTGEGSLPEATLGPAPDTPAVLLRLEGDPGTTFSGICAVGGKESILSGRIPKRYAFDPRGQRLSCRIEKQDAGGDLKVILIAGDTTRSVQQTNTRGSVINVSYTGD
jgi:hypothetical protein